MFLYFSVTKNPMCRPSIRRVKASNAGSALKTRIVTGIESHFSVCKSLTRTLFILVFRGRRRTLIVMHTNNPMDARRMPGTAPDKAP